MSDDEFIQRFRARPIFRPLTPAERETVLASLLEEAKRDIKAEGCTCEPTFSWTEKGYGRHDLPMVESDHSDDCALSQAMPEGVERGLYAGDSARRLLGL